MEPKIIKIDVYGIKISLTGDGKGSISSNLRESDPQDAYFNIAELNRDIASIKCYNSIIDALEAIILAHAIAGIDVTSPAYMEGIETACQGCKNVLENEMFPGE